MKPADTGFTTCEPARRLDADRLHNLLRSLGLEGAAFQAGPQIRQSGSGTSNFRETEPRVEPPLLARAAARVGNENTEHQSG